MTFKDKTPIEKIVEYERNHPRTDKWYTIYNGPYANWSISPLSEVKKLCKKLNGTKITKVIATATILQEFFKGKVIKYSPPIKHESIAMTVVDSTTTITVCSFSKAKKLFSKALGNPNTVWASITSKKFVETEVWRKKK